MERPANYEPYRIAQEIAASMGGEKTLGPACSISPAIPN